MLRNFTRRSLEDEANHDALPTWGQNYGHYATAIVRSRCLPSCPSEECWESPLGLALISFNRKRPGLESPRVVRQLPKHRSAEFQRCCGLDVRLNKLGRGSVLLLRNRKLQSRSVYMYLIAIVAAIAYLLLCCTINPYRWSSTGAVWGCRIGRPRPHSRLEKREDPARSSDACHKLSTDPRLQSTRPYAPGTRKRQVETWGWSTASPATVDLFSMPLFAPPLAL